MSMSESSAPLNGSQPIPIPLLEVQELEQRFGGIVAVYDMNLTVQHGEVHGIIGPNGAGKTTLSIASLACARRLPGASC